MAQPRPGLPWRRASVDRPPPTPAWSQNGAFLFSNGQLALADTSGWNSELAREKVWSRIHLIPLLQAEEDRDLVRRHLADQAREKELLGENIKVYNSDRYAISISP